MLIREDCTSDMRTILHSDMNCFYAAVECFHRPEIRHKPVIVGGSEESRHGIVLAKNEIAKKFGIKTGEALWEARKKCPGLVSVPPNYRLYTRYSKLARKIYYSFTDLVEPFGLDEAWLDVTNTVTLQGVSPMDIAQQISNRIQFELGVTVSIGISWNKIYAKFGSDYKKPNAITMITPENYQNLVYTAPANDLLYVGRATKEKLRTMAILTIGDLANASPKALKRKLGVMGHTLQTFARGEDISPVRAYGSGGGVKSVGNGMTSPRDLRQKDEVKMLVFLLSESVAQRLRELYMRATVMSVSCRHGETLVSYSRQTKLPAASNITNELAAAAFRLVEENEPLNGSTPLRSISVRASGLVGLGTEMQTNMFISEEKRIKFEKADRAIDQLRNRFGNKSIMRAIELGDRMSRIDIKSDHTIHPVSFFRP